MATTIVTKTSAFTIADADIGAGDDSVTYRCTGNFAVTIPSTGPSAEKVFVIQSTDGLQSFNTTTATVNVPQDKELEPYGTNATIIIVCHSTGNYDISGDLVAVPLASLSKDEVSFSYNLTVDFPVAETTAVNIEWDEKRLDTHDGMDTATGKYRCPVAGRYQFNTSLRFDSVGGTIQYEIANSTTGFTRNQQYQGSSHAADYQPYSHSVILDCLEGDDIYVNIRCSSDSSYHIDYRSHFSGHLISPAVVIAPNGITHAFSVNKGGTNQVTVATGNTKLSWSDSKKQTNVSFDFVNDEFVAPSDGWYTFSTGVRVTTLASSAATTLGITISDATTWGPHGTSGETNLNSSALTATGYMLAGEAAYVKLSQYESATETIDGSTLNTWFMGHKISGTSTGVEYDSYDIGFKVAHSGTDQVITSADTWEKVSTAFGTPTEDIGGNWDSTNHRFTAAVSGQYQFNAYLFATTISLGDSAYIALYKGGVLLERIGQDAYSGTTAIVSGSSSVYLAAGEYVELWWRATPALAKIPSSAAETIHFSGHLVRATTKAESSFEVDNGGTALTSIVTATWTQVVIAAAKSNIGNNFDVTNNKFVAPADGRYAMHATFLWTSDLVNGIRIDGRFYINPKDGGADYPKLPRASTVSNDLSSSICSGILNLKKGDEVTFEVRHNDTVSRDGHSAADWTRWDGYRLATSPTASLTEEVGTWEATLSGGATTTPTSTTDGEYVKIGSMVTVSLNTDFGSLVVNGSAIKISGLPFTASATHTGSLGQVARAVYTSASHHYCEVLGATTEVVFKKMAANAGSPTTLLSEASGTYTPVYRFNLTYFTNE